MRPEQAKMILERVHLKYLCEPKNGLPFEKIDDKSAVIANSRMPLRTPSNARPDLISAIDPNTIFELKSRIHPLQQANSKLPRSSFGWWQIDLDQIARYEELQREYDINIHWIFILATTKTQSTHMRTITEKDILDRDIYIAPWEAHFLAAGREKQYINIGLNRLLEAYSFERKPINKGTIYIASSIADAVLKKSA